MEGCGVPDGLGLVARGAARSSDAMEGRLKSAARRGVGWRAATEGRGELSVGGVEIFRLLDEDCPDNTS